MVHKCKKLLLSMIVVFGSVSAKIKKQCNRNKVNDNQVLIETSCEKSSDNRSLLSWVSSKVDKLNLLYTFVFNLVTGHKEDAVAQQLVEAAELPSEVSISTEAVVVVEVQAAEVEAVLANVDNSTSELVEKVRARAEVSVPEDYSAVEVGSELVLTFPSFYEKLENEVITVLEKVVDGQRCFEVSQVSPVNNSVCLSVVYHIATPAGLSVNPSKEVVVDRSNSSMVVIHVPVVKDARASGFSLSPLRLIISLSQNA